MVDKGEAYYCFCTKERLEKLHESGAVGYDRHCRNLTQQEIDDNLAKGLPYVIRQKMPVEGESTYNDLVYGDITVPYEDLDDQILLKADGFPTYNFANVIDDHLMGITHVVRGNEYLSSTPKYNRLYEAYGWEIPTYIHCPLITDETHKKLSKRCGHSSYEDLIDQGFITEAVVNFVALLGWCPEGNQEIFSLEELVKIFDFHHMTKSPSVFDYTKLKWMNGEYFKAMDPEVFYEKAESYLKEYISRDVDLRKVSEMVRTRIEVFPDIKDHVDFIDAVPEYSIDMYTHKKMKTDSEKSLALLNEVIPVLEAHDDYTNDSLFALLSNFAQEKEYKTGFVMWPIRTALSGKQMTPCGATEILELLGKEEYKEMEGDPEVKARLKQMQKDMLSQNIPKAVREADVVITNPTHFAVSLKYDREVSAAPVVTAKGEDQMALTMRRLATESNIPIVEDRPLARALYTDFEVNEMIDERYLKTVAIIYSHILKDKV